MSNWEICSSYSLVFFFFSPGGRPAYSAGPKQVPNAPAPTSLRLFTFFCLRVLGLSRFRPAGDQRVPLDRSRCHMHLHRASLRLSLFFCFLVHGLFPISPGGRPACSAGPKQVPFAPAPREPSALSLFFVFWFMVFSRFRPAGDQRIPLDRSRCHTHLHLASLRLFFFL